MRREKIPLTGLVVREARPDDNDALTDLELRSPLLVGESEEKYDRSPDFFACYRVQGEHRVILAEADGRPVGVMAGVMQAPVIQGAERRLVYIQRARVLPEFQGQGVAWRLANDLFAWSSALGAEGPYYLIAPGNERSMAFGGRAGRRWPVDVRLLTFDVSGASEDIPPSIAVKQLGEAAALINSTHAASDFFEPVIAESLMARLSRDDQYQVQICTAPCPAAGWWPWQVSGTRELTRNTSARTRREWRCGREPQSSSIGVALEVMSASCLGSWPGWRRSRACTAGRP